MVIMITLESGIVMWMSCQDLSANLSHGVILSWKRQSQEPSALWEQPSYPLDDVQGMMNAWQGKCGKLDQYGMQYSRLFANLCNAGVSVDALQTAAHAVCRPASEVKMAVA